MQSDEWRLGRLRCRQRILLPEPDPVLGSRGLARSTHRRRHGALRVDARSARSEVAARANALDKGIAYLLRTQEKDGSWYGRWGMNYIYGTWSVLCALNAARVDAASPAVRKAVQWLLSIQNPDGGWGEGGESYKLDYRGYEPAPSTASQTAWALLGLMAAGEVDHPSVAKGIDYLVATPREGRILGRGTASPRPASRASSTFAITAMRNSFPLWALARYRNLRGRQHHFRSGRDVSDSGERGFVIAATGLRAEARIAARSERSEPSPAGGDRARLGSSSAGDCRRRRRPSSASALPPVWRQAGGAGTCLVGSEVVHAGKRYAADPAWTARLRSAYRRMLSSSTIAGIDRPLPLGSAKQALHVRDRCRCGRHGKPYCGAARRRAWAAICRADA